MAEIKNPSVFNMGKPFPKTFNKYLTGQAYFNQLVAADLSVYNMTFAPACRNNWHIHHKYGQILLVTGGRGWYQEWGKIPQALKPGDVVNIASEVKHWHGAAKDSWFSHLVVENHNDDTYVEWLEPVNDAYYFQVEIMNAE